MLKFFKYVGTFASAIGIGTIISKFLNRWLEKRGYSDPDNALEAVTFWIATLPRSGWFLWVMALSIVLAAAYWALKIGLVYLNYRSKALENIGVDMMAMARKIKGSAVGPWGPPWPNRLQGLRSEMATLLASARFYWIWTPTDAQIDEPQNARIVHDYFDFVGSFLHKDMLKEARRHARGARAKIFTP